MRLAYVSFAIVLAAARAAAAEDIIRDIVVEGNTKTTSATVELIAKIDVGDDWTADMLDRIKRDLVSSGLFRDVEAFFEQCGPTGVPKCDAPGVRVHLTVHDKHSWVIAPAIYDEPTYFAAGLGFGENNLFGENQKLLLYGQLASRGGDSFFIGAWVLPSIHGSRFYAQLDTFLKQSQVIEYGPAHGYTDIPTPVRQSVLNYLNAGFKLGVDLFWGLKLDARLRGAHVGYGKISALTSDANQIGPGADVNAPPPPGKEGWDVSNEISLAIDRRADWFGVRTGYRYQASYEYGVPQLGSDFHYQIYNLSLWKGVQVLERHNLTAQVNVNVGHHLPFQQEFTMGGTSMRGYVNNQFRGDLHVAANLEYSLPLFTVFGLSVRGLGFFDSGYTTFLTTSNPERTYLPHSAFGDNSTLAPLKNSVGIGTRLFLQQIVIPLLGVDLGYGLEARDVQVYLAIGLTN
ncbi:MAG TPA: BamA/TamA family outer membrane protein [Kofleriaceae bacterium]